MTNKYTQTYDRVKLAQMQARFREKKKGVPVRALFYVVSIFAIAVFVWF